MDSNVEVIKRLFNAGVSPYKAKVQSRNENGAVYGKSFIFTGTLKDFTRGEAENIVKAAGGIIEKTIKKKLDYVVAGSDPGSKYDKAVKLNLNIINEDEFKKILNK